MPFGSSSRKNEKSRRVVYWKITKWGGHSTTVEFWTKPGNAISAIFVTLTEETLRRRIEDVTGWKSFELSQEGELPSGKPIGE